MLRGQDYEQIPENRHRIAAATILLPTKTPLTPQDGTSRDFVLGQGGDDDTFIFLLGTRRAEDLAGREVEFIEGIFLSKHGQGFHATWGHEQLLREVDAGGWKVVPTAEVLEGWTAKVEERMNRGERPRESGR